MSTQKTDFRKEQAWIKRMFQQLFQIQIRLGKYLNNDDRFYSEISSIIRMIDELMQFLMNLFEFEE